jgi:transposase
MFETLPLSVQPACREGFMKSLIPEDITFTEVKHLPIVKHFAKKINLVDTFDTMVDSQMELSPGVAILAMVLDTLSDRTPLYRLEEFLFEKDTELLLGSDVPSERFSDYNLGRVLDKIHQTGTQKIFSTLAQNAVDAFDIDARRVHFDTTSVSVYGDYDFSDEPFNITYGHSKDKRPDLRQFLISLLCVDRNIPILGTCEDGNASDKTLNNGLLGNISRHMARHGLEQGAFVYVADSAFVTPDNLESADQKGIKFLTHLPANYNECSRAIGQAVAADNWIDIGTMNQTNATSARQPTAGDLRPASSCMADHTALW